MYLCCDRKNNIIGRVETEKEAQEKCSSLGSSYIKIIPIFFWFMRNYNRFYIYKTTKGFLKHRELIKSIKERIKKDYNILDCKSIEDAEKIILVLEEFVGDCTDMVFKRIQQSV